MSECVLWSSDDSQLARTHFLEHRYETSAAIIETETSTAELAEEVRNRATQARVAAKEAALIAEVSQPHRPLISSVSKLTTGSCHVMTFFFLVSTGPTALAEWRCPGRGHDHRRSGRSAADIAGSGTASARDGRTHKGRRRARRIHGPRTSKLDYLLSRLFFFLVEEVSHSHTLPWAHTRLRDPASPAMSMTL